MGKIYVKDKSIFKKKVMEKGYNIKGFSHECGVSNSYMSSVINGRVSLSAPLSKKITKELNCSFKTLFFIK